MRSAPGSFAVARLPRPRGLLFDMDGTLTRPLLNFDAIRAEIGIRGPILEAIRHFAPADLARANAILDRHERQASEQSTLNDGCIDLLTALDRWELPRGLVTRNSRPCVEIVLLRHGMRFDAILSREDHPPKPHPDALRNACRRLRVSPDAAWMIGDGSHDVEAGVAAGMTTIWISHGKPRDFEPAPTLSVETLGDVIHLLQAALRD